MSSSTPLRIREEPTLKCGPVRLSKRGAWRALSLTLVHVAIIAHFVHWKVAGTTVTPVEPSEAMQTLETGAINAGFILFSLLILSTLVFGRFFCGWGCHVVAYQDLCGWLLKKAGIKPKPFRSRLLVWVPVFAALYMFALPTVLRWIEGSAFASFKWHLTTDDYWATFPGFWIGLLTFVVCGFLIVYVMGNKGFCTYGCPYGAFFFHADRVAPGKIRVTEDCEHCGHCTASCTSNVRVHEEVKHYGMVVDAGCMKCMDCISVCPKNALYYGFGPTALSKDAIKLNRLPREALSKRVYDFSLPEEVALAALFAASFYAYRGLYDGLPLLLSIGLSSITAYLLLVGARLAYKPNLRFQRWQLRSSGKWTVAGKVAASLCFLLLAFVAHSFVWQLRYHEGDRLYASAETLNRANKTDHALEKVRAAITHYQWCSSYGLAATGQLEAKLGTAYAFLGDYESALKRMEIAMTLVPQLAGARYQYARTLARVGRNIEAEEQMRLAFEKQPNLPGLARDYAMALANGGATEKAVSVFAQVLKQNPADVESRIAYGLLLAQVGKVSEGEAELRRAVRDRPSSALGHMNLGLVLAERNQMGSAIREMEEAVRLEPTLAGARLNLARLAASQRQFSKADAQFNYLISKAPYDPSLLATWAEVQVQSGRAVSAKRIILATPRSNLKAWYRLVFLYRAMGEGASAQALYRSLLAQKPTCPSRELPASFPWLIRWIPMDNSVLVIGVDEG